MAAFDLQASLQGAKEAYDQGIGTLKGYHDSSRNFIVQSALADQANAHEIAMWNMQNEYNTPAAQMQRFKAAGLNPMLVYQQGNPGNASSMPGTHVPNVKMTENADRQAEIDNVLNIVNTVSGLIGQSMGLVDQGIQTASHMNDLRWSNMQAAGARQLFGDDYGRRNMVGISRYAQGFDFSQVMDPSNPKFNPLIAQVMHQIGADQYYPRHMTAEANAYLAGKRADYQQWYNESFAPLLEQYKSGQIGIQDLQYHMLDYQNQMLNMLPPEFRAIIAPLFDYIRPFINSLLRR